jgi:hypothetical protein
MPIKKKAHKRELIEPTKGDKRYVRRDVEGKFSKVVDVGRWLSVDRRRDAQAKVPKGQGDRGDIKK